VNCLRRISRAPNEASSGVFIWQSISPNCHCFRCCTKATSAIFDASEARENIDSPKNMRPMAIP
jgi:hypothetical protein